MKCVIICDGEIPPLSIFQNDLNCADIIIAADGGAYHAFKLGIEPFFIIGDLDSYKPSGQEKTEIIHDPDQETNDLEKALAFALKRAVDEVVVIGATGKRLDHTLKNLSVLLQFHRKFKTILFKDRYSIIRLIESPFREEFETGTSLSLFPLSGSVEGITTRGLQYPLRNGTLHNGIQDGSSNKTVKETVEIVFKKGDLLLLVNHKSTK